VRASLFWLLASACGRIAFDPLGSATTDGGASDSGGDAVDGPTGLVPTRSQCQYTTTTTLDSTLAATLPNPIQSTDTIVVAIGWNTVGANISEIKDTGGSTFVAAAAALQGGAVVQAMYLATAPVPGFTTVTVNFSQAVINASIRVCVYAGTDQNMGPPALGGGGNGTFATAGPLTTTIPNSLVLAAVTGTDAASLDLAYVTAINTMPLGHILEQRAAANPAGYQVSASFAVNADWVIQMIALQPR
jgi:hypothetical protein